MNKTKIKPKLILGAVVVILIFSLLPGALAAKSTKWDFAFVAEETLFVPLGLPWTDEDGVFHMRFYKENDLISGNINGIPIITGETKETFHMKIDPNTGMMVVNGKGTFYIEWNGQKGTFYGTIKAKIVAGIMDGKCTMQGAGHFDGWKLFGIIWNIPQPNPEDPTTNGISGTILIPN